MVHAFFRQYASLIQGSLLASFLGFFLFLGNPDKVVLALLVVFLCCAVSWCLQGSLEFYRTQLDKQIFVSPVSLEELIARENNLEEVFSGKKQPVGFYQRVLKARQSYIFDHEEFQEALPKVSPPPHLALYKKTLFWGLVLGIPGVVLTLLGYGTLGLILSVSGSILAPQGLFAVTYAAFLSKETQVRLQNSMNDSWNTARLKSENILYLESLPPVQKNA